MLLCLANIGTSMANLFRFMYARVCCGYCNYVKRRHIRMKAATLSTAAVTHANALSFAALATTNLVINGNQANGGGGDASSPGATNSDQANASVATNIVSPQQPLGIDTVVLSDVSLLFIM